MWVEEDFQIEFKSILSVSYHIGNWKCVRKSMERELKSTKELHGNSIYHLVVVPISVL